MQKTGETFIVYKRKGTGKREKEIWLKKLGASEVIDRRKINYGKRPLETARWAGAVDTVGGDTLAGLIRNIKSRGNIACIGLVGGHELHTTVMPFLLKSILVLFYPNNQGFI